MFGHLKQYSICVLICNLQEWLCMQPDFQWAELLWIVRLWKLKTWLYLILWQVLQTTGNVLISNEKGLILQASISICSFDSASQLLLTLDSQRCRDFFQLLMCGWGDAPVGHTLGFTFWTCQCSQSKARAFHLWLW